MRSICSQNFGRAVRVPTTAGSESADGNLRTLSIKIQFETVAQLPGEFRDVNSIAAPNHFFCRFEGRAKYSYRSIAFLGDVRTRCRPRLELAVKVFCG